MINWAALQDRVNTMAVQVFGDGVTVDGVSVTADFIEPSDEAFLEGVSGMTTAPQLIILTKDVPSAPVGKVVVHGVKSYRIAQIAQDGFGLSRCMLERAL
jgi:hypothetical protein